MLALIDEKYKKYWASCINHCHILDKSRCFFVSWALCISLFCLQFLWFIGPHLSLMMNTRVSSKLSIPLELKGGLCYVQVVIFIQPKGKNYIQNLGNVLKRLFSLPGNPWILLDLVQICSRWHMLTRLVLYFVFFMYLFFYVKVLVND